GCRRWCCTPRGARRPPRRALSWLAADVLLEAQLDAASNEAQNAVELRRRNPEPRRELLERSRRQLHARVVEPTRDRLPVDAVDRRDLRVVEALREGEAKERALALRERSERGHERGPELGAVQALEMQELRPVAGIGDARDDLFIELLVGRHP